MMNFFAFFVGVFSVGLNISNELSLFELKFSITSSFCRDVWVEGSAIRAETKNLNGCYFIIT